MAYKTEDLYKKAMEIVKDDGNHFIDDIIAALPCDKTTFYRHFPVDCNQYNNIKGALEQNRIQVKQRLRKNWDCSGNPTMELALYKLIGSEEERKRLSQQYQDHKIDGELNITVKREKKPPIEDRV